MLNFSSSKNFIWRQRSFFLILLILLILCDKGKFIGLWYNVDVIKIEIIFQSLEVFLSIYKIFFLNKGGRVLQIGRIRKYRFVFSMRVGNFEFSGIVLSWLVCEVVCVVRRQRDCSFEQCIVGLIVIAICRSDVCKGCLQRFVRIVF